MVDITLEEARNAGAKMKARAGLTDEQFEKLVSNPFNRRLMVCHDELAKYKIVAEVIESQRCGAGCKVGQKFVFKAIPTVLLPAESDCSLCVKALGPIAELIHGMWDRLSEGLDPNGGIGLYASCLDMGLEYGGLGNVKFRLHMEKASSDSGVPGGSQQTG